MLLRMISSLNKWDKESNPIIREDPSFPADAVTDLKTTRNKLSVWEAGTDDEINDAIVAMTLGRDSIAKLCFVYLDENELERIGIKAIQDEPGSAPGIESIDLLNRHMNLQHLDYVRLGSLTDYIYHQLDANKFIIKTKQELNDLLISYKEKGIIATDKIKDHLREKLKW